MDHDFLEQIRKVIRMKIDDPTLGVTDLCQAVHLSRFQLHRRIRGLTGKPATLYIRALRLEYAQKLLKENELSVTEVALECGFNDPAFFSRVFKEEFGLPPSKYRDG